MPTRLTFQPHGWALAGAVLGLAACHSPDQPRQSASPLTPKPAPAGVAAAFSASLVEKQLGPSRFFISLPPGYALTTTEGPDFRVYYFAPADTTVAMLFSGGLYVGYQPQLPDSTVGCRTRTLPATLLGRPARWTLNQCATGYTLSTVVAGSGRPGEAEQLNAFGETRSAAGLRQLLAVYATLRQQPAPATTPH